MRLYALSDLRLRCKQRCDKETDAHIGDPEWNRLISEMYGEVFSVAEGAGMRHFESTQPLSPNGTSATFALPLDHLATIDVEFVYDTVNNRRRRLRRMNVQERTRWMGLQGDARRWEPAGNTIILYPTPAAGSNTYVHTYMPQAPDLSLAPDATQVDLVNAHGEDFLMWGVAVKALAKSEGVTDLAMTERDAARERFTTWCAMRSFNDAPRPYVDTGDEFEEWGDPWNPASFAWNPPR